MNHSSLGTRHSSLINIKTISIAFIMIASIYSIITPIFEASDELWHYPLVQWLSKGNPLPIQSVKNVGPWKQEASQPPLYYYLMGWATFWIDTGDLSQARLQNPHVEPGVITSDGNINLVTHDPVRESFPWRGAVLAVHLVRFLSVLMGAVTVWLTYHIALELFPDRSYLAMGAAAINAFTPMFVFISGAINNDNLTMTLCALSLWLMIKRLRASGIRDQRQQTNDQTFSSSVVGRSSFGYQLGRWLPLGIVLGLAALTKTSALGLLPITALTVSIVAWRKNSWREFFAGAIATTLPVLLIAGWWYLRNIQLYGDVLGLSAFMDVLGRRAAPASLLQLWGERWGFMLSFWGLFGGVNLPLDNWVYHVLNALAILAFIGAIIYLVRITLEWFRSDPIQSWRDLRYELRDYLQGRAPLFIVGLFGLIVVVSLTQWASITWSSQGRLVFSAISTWSIFFVVGLATLFGSRFARLAITAISVFMFFITLLAPFTTIAPAYARTPPVQSIQSPTVSFDVTFNHQLKLIGADVKSKSTRPGGSIELTLYWQASVPIEKDYSTFVHLLDENEIVVAQRDMFPGQGLWPTSQIKVGDIIPSRYVINLPATSYVPDKLIFEVGVYDYTSQTRLLMLDGADNLRFGSINLQSAAVDVPNPISYNFGGQIDLVGYLLDRRSAAPNDTLQLTLYWRARSKMPIDYTVFTHILQPPQTIWAQQDKPLSPSSASWTIGQTISQTYDLHLKPDTPSGVYVIEVGLYDSANFDRLRIVADDGRITDNFVLLSKVRVRQ